MCSSNTSGNLKYCNIRIWSWQRLELNSVWEKQAAKKLSCLFHVSPPQKKTNPPFPHKQLKTKTPNVSTRFRFYRKPWSSFPELKAVALSGFPHAHSAAHGPSGVNKTTPGGHGEGELREPCFPHSFHLLHRGSVSRRSAAHGKAPTPGPRTGLSPPARPSRCAPAPHLLRDPLRLVGGGPGRRGSPAHHGGTYVILPGPLRADPAPRAV